MSDYAQCDSKYQRCTLNALPYNNNLLKKSKLPLSLLLEPYPRTQPREKNLNQVPVISHGTISRCIQCKSFINPFIQFIEGGLKWQCNICGYDDNNGKIGHLIRNVHKTHCKFEYSSSGV